MTKTSLTLLDGKVRGGSEQLLETVLEEVRETTEVFIEEQKHHIAYSHPLQALSALLRVTTAHGKLVVFHLEGNLENLRLQGVLNITILQRQS